MSKVVSPQIVQLQEILYNNINKLNEELKGAAKIKFAKECQLLSTALNESIQNYEYLLDKYGDLLDKS